MARRLHPTFADYIVIALSPVLIMLLVGSLVFFLVQVFYQGSYDTRLSVILALFVMAAVLIARISIEESREYAMLFAIPLGLVTAVAMHRFVEFSGPLKSFSLFINLGLIGLIWWCADRLTWDSTVIDESEDASGEGLLQTAGLDDQATTESGQVAARAAAEQPRATLWQRFVAYRRRKHSPGVWVIYFSLAALPIFGFGNWFIPGDDLGTKRYVFKLLVVYVGSALGLLLTTSFLSLRRYLRQRRLEMPVEMAGTWIGTGAAMIVALLVVCTLLPRRNPEYSITQLPMFAGSPTDLWTTEHAIGNEGQEDLEKGDRPGAKPSSGAGPTNSNDSGQSDQQSQSEEQKNSDPAGSQAQSESSSGNSSNSSGQSQDSSEAGGKNQESAQQQSDQASGQSQNSGQQQSSNASKPQPDPESSPSGESQQPSEKSKSRKSGDSKNAASEPGNERNSEQSDSANSPSKAGQKKGSRKSPSQQGSPDKQSTNAERNQRAEQQKEPQPRSSPKSAEQKDQEQQSEKTQNANAEKSEPPQPQPQSRFDPSKIASALGGTIGQLLKLLYWLIAFAVVGYFVWKYWRQIQEAIANFVKSLREFWESLFGRKITESAAEAAALEVAPPPVSFSAFQDPFHSGMAQSKPPVEVIRYSFAALEAWAREFGCPRGPEQTPHEFVQLIGSAQQAVARDAANLAEMYNRCAFSRDVNQRINIEPLRRLWQQMRDTLLIQPTSSAAGR